MDMILVDRSMNIIGLNGKTVEVRPLVSDFAFFLTTVGNGEVFDKAKIASEVWGDRAIVSDDSIYQVVSELRRALKKLGSVQEIKTVRKRGFYLQQGLSFVSAKPLTDTEIDDQERIRKIS